MSRLGGRGGMHVVVYGCKTGPLILREEYKLCVLEFGPRKNEMTKDND